MMFMSVGNKTKTKKKKTTQLISVLSPVQPSSPQGCVFLQRCIRSTNKVCLEERGRKRSRSQTLSEESTLAPQSFSSTRIKQKEDKLSREAYLQCWRWASAKHGSRTKSQNLETHWQSVSVFTIFTPRRKHMSLAK